MADLHDSHAPGDEPLLTVAEMDRAFNDLTDPYHLSYAELVQVFNRLIPRVPVDLSAAVCEVMKGRTP